MVCLTPTRVILFTKLIKGVIVIISSLDFFFFPILMWSILIDLQDRPRVVSKASPQKIQLLEKEYETMHALHLLWPARCMRKNKGRWKLGKGMLWMIDQILH